MTDSLINVDSALKWIEWTGVTPDFYTATGHALGFPIRLFVERSEDGWTYQVNEICNRGFDRHFVDTFEEAKACAVKSAAFTLITQALAPAP